MRSLSSLSSLASLASLRSRVLVPDSVDSMDSVDSLDYRAKHGLLHVQAVFGFVNGGALRPVEHAVGDDDIAAHRQAVHEPPLLGRAHNLFVNAPVSVLLAQRDIVFGATIELFRAPALGVDDLGTRASRTL